MKTSKIQKIRHSKIHRIVRNYIKSDTVHPILMIISILQGILIGITCVVFQIIPDTILSFLYTKFSQLGYSLTSYLSIFCISGTLAAIAIYITKKYAPEAGGSGIPEIEGALDHKRPIRWKRVLPVKLLGGICSISSGMILGREGPSIQIGGNLGKMIADIFLLSRNHAMTLVAAGGAAGLASAFNAPLAGILFVLEELRPQFKYSFLAIKVVSITVIAATITRCLLIDNQAVFYNIPNFICPNTSEFIWFAIFGIIIGFLGYGFNKLVEIFQNGYSRIFNNSIFKSVAIMFVVGGVFGIIFLIIPQAAGSGMFSIESWIRNDNPTLIFISLLLLWRIIGTMLCFGSGIPGGIFAPSLSIGTLSGLLFGSLIYGLHLTNINPGVFAIVGMSTLFAASVMAPVTGIILVTEMTHNYEFILPMMIATLCSTLTAQTLGSQPIYSQILARTLRIASSISNNKIK